MVRLNGFVTREGSNQLFASLQLGKVLYHDSLFFVRWGGIVQVRETWRNEYKPWDGGLMALVRSVGADSYRISVLRDCDMRGYYYDGLVLFTQYAGDMVCGEVYHANSCSDFSNLSVTVGVPDKDGLCTYEYHIGRYKGRVTLHGMLSSSDIMMGCVLDYESIFFPKVDNYINVEEVFSSISGEREIMEAFLCGKILRINEFYYHYEGSSVLVRDGWNGESVLYVPGIIGFLSNLKHSDIKASNGHYKYCYS